MNRQAMEHRLNRREPVNLMVRLVNGGQVVATVRAVDMSPGGLGIESPELPLHSGQCVGVDFCKPGYPRGISCYLTAMVIHTTPKLTGLMFTDEGPLQAMVNGQSVGSA